MVLYTLEYAREQLAFWNEKARAAADFQASSVENRTRRRAELAHIQQMIKHWEGWVLRLSAPRGRRTFYIVGGGR